MKDVVFLVGRYYPMYSAPGLCAAQLINGLKNDYNITVIAIQTHNLRGNKEQRIEGVNVIFVTNWRNSLRVLVTDLEAQGKIKLAAVIEPFVRVLNLLATVFLYPCRDVWYRRKSCCELAVLHRKRPVDIVVSVSFPFATHLAARWFTKRVQGVKWVSYSVDTMFQNPTMLAYSCCRSLKRFVLHQMEPWVLSCASYNFVTPEIYQAAHSMLNKVTRPCSVLDYIMPELPAPSSEASCFVKGKCNVFFAGAFYKTIRSPEYMLKVFAKVESEDIILHLYVRQGDCADMLSLYQSRMGERLRLHSTVAPSEYKSLIQKADVLLNIENNLDAFLPSKIYEYFVTGKPIISFKYAERSQHPAIGRYPCLLQIENFGDELSDARSIARFCLSHKGQQVDCTEIYACYPENTLGSVVNKFRSVLSSSDIN